MNTDKIKQYLTNPLALFLRLGEASFLRGMDDGKYLRLKWRCSMVGELDLDHPKTFNEKLQWLKLHDRKPEYAALVDKYEAKKVIAQKIGEEYIVPTLGVYDRFDEIDFDALPDKFVIKCTHDSGGLVIVRDKSNFDKAAAKKKIEKKLRQSFYWHGREWPYKNVKPRIIVEKYIEDNSGSGKLTDYKFFCFRGVADCVMICLDREIGEATYLYFDKEWNFKPYGRRHPTLPEGFNLQKPMCMDKMVELAETLSEDFPFARVDFYQSDDKVYFGEITFFPASGFDAGIIPEIDLYLGSLLDIDSLKAEEK